MSAQQWFTNLMALGGITPNGVHRYDPKILNPDFYSRVRRDGVLGLGESYMDGWWTCEQLDELVFRLLDREVEKRAGPSLPVIYGAARAWLLNLQSVRRAFQIGERHYDLGNELFERMLGPSMAYSCARFKGVNDLDLAQFAKFKLICDKLKLEPGQRVLDIGCGWGTLAKYMAKFCGVHVIGLTVSRQQAEYARRICRDLNVAIRLQDYRDFCEPVDRIVSVGMLEHVGVKNYRDFMRVARRALGDNREGLFLLHTIGSLCSGINTNPWIERYIFPNSMIPSLRQITRSAEGLFVVEDVENFGSDYDRTLMAWYRNFVVAWPELAARYPERYDERFFRMWEYYLLTCAGAFGARDLQVWQIVLSPRGVLGGYQSVR